MLVTVTMYSQRKPLSGLDAIALGDLRGLEVARIAGDVRHAEAVDPGEERVGDGSVRIVAGVEVDIGCRPPVRRSPPCWATRSRRASSGASGMLICTGIVSEATHGNVDGRERIAARRAGGPPAQAQVGSPTVSVAAAGTVSLTVITP